MIQRLFVFFLIFIFQVEAKPNQPLPTYELAVVAIFHNEAPYLREWIEFHKLVGATHFYLYNHLSSDNYREVLLPYLDKGEVELFDWEYPYQNHDEWVTIQGAAYENCLSRASGKVKWLAILDIDEFLFNPNGKTVQETLEPLDLHNPLLGGVVVSWYLFGTSYIPKIASDQLLIETLILSSGKSNIPIHVKTICRPERVKKMSNPHLCIYYSGYKQYNLQTLRINHYWTRDEDYFMNQKMQRQLTWNLISWEKAKKWANSMNGFSDTAIQIYASSLRKALTN